MLGPRAECEGKLVFYDDISRHINRSRAVQSQTQSSIQSTQPTPRHRQSMHGSDLELSANLHEVSQCPEKASTILEAFALLKPLKIFHNDSLLTTLLMIWSLYSSARKALVGTFNKEQAQVEVLSGHICENSQRFKVRWQCSILGSTLNGV